jgi:choloylglycine hydrolase
MMCTVFKLQTDQASKFIVGKNYDTKDPCYGMIFTNPRNIKKTALIMQPDTPKQWNSVFGSVTFSQVGKEFPSCGMNEAGLVVEQTTLWNTVYPDRDQRPAVKELQWIQYMLDTCATVDDVMRQLPELRVTQEVARIQYFVCDETGDCALIEYILGKEIIFRNAELPYPVIANDMYQTSLDYLHIHQGYGGKKEFTQSSLSIDRFVTTVHETEILKENENMDDQMELGFYVLQQSEFDQTQWKIVYLPRTKTIGYRTKESAQLKIITLGQFDFSEREKNYVKNIESDQSKEFMIYSTEINYQLAKSFFTTNILAKTVKISEEMIRRFSEYPETLQKI